MTTEAASGFTGAKAVQYDERGAEWLDDNEEVNKTRSTPEVEEMTSDSRYALPVKSNDENLRVDWSHNSNESGEISPFSNNLNDTFIDSVFSDQYTPLFRDVADGSLEAHNSCKSAAIQGCDQIHLSKNHEHWEIKKDLRQMCLSDESIRKTIEASLRKLDSYLGNADLVARIETDNHEPSDPRPLIHVTMPVKSAKDWHSKKTTIRDLVQEVEHGDAIVYTTVDRKQ